LLDRGDRHPRPGALAMTARHCSTAATGVPDRERSR
jgi:hypothetical protein